MEIYLTLDTANNDAADRLQIIRMVELQRLLDRVKS